MDTYHVIPHTHWDREWYLSFDHFRVRLVHMLDDLLNILDTRPDFKSFTLDGQTSVLNDYLEIKPGNRDKIEKYVREGRLFIGPWYILPDEFLVSGEATIRNLTRGRETAHRFGASMDVGYIPDSFGHIAQMPQILKGFDIDSAIVWRGFGGEPDQISSEYQWRSPDGSIVLMEHLSDVGYSAGYFNSTDSEIAEERFLDFKKRVDYRARTSERLMLNGGDHHWPYRNLPDVLAYLNDKYKGEARLVHSSITRFMKEMGEKVTLSDLPVADGELKFGYRWAFNVTGGVYSSRLYIKQANTRSQWLLERYLEPLNAMAMMRGGRTQSELIRQGWTYLMQNHPHDSICGCSIDPVHREMMTRFEKLGELGKGVEYFAWMDLVPDKEGASGDDQYLVFFNPSPFKRNEIVECDVEFFKQKVVVGLNPDVVVDPPLPDVEGFELHDDHDVSIPFEVVDRHEDFGIAYNRFDYPSQTKVDKFHIRVLLNDLPPLGLRKLKIVRKSVFSTYPQLSSFDSGDDYLENQFIRVSVDGNGSFYVTDKTTGYQYGPLGYFEDGADAGDEYNYSPPDNDRVLSSTESARVTIHLMDGQYRKGLQVRGTWDLPASLTEDENGRIKETERIPFSITAWLTPESRFVQFETTLTNTVKDHRLRAVFKTGCNTNIHRADSQFGILQREQQQYDPDDYDIEVPASVAPMQRYVIIDDGKKAASLIAVGLPEYELKYNSNGELALTLLRCTGELGRGAIKMRPGGRGGWKNSTPDAQCPGEHHFTYAFMPHPAGWAGQVDDINRVAESIHLPVKIHRSKAGNMDQEDEWTVDISPTNLVMSAFKEANNGDGYILRIYNPTDEEVEGEVRLSGNVTGIKRTSLDEIDGDLVSLKNSAFTDQWQPYKIKTYRVRVSKPDRF